jgi:outer membrane protein
MLAIADRKSMNRCVRDMRKQIHLILAAGLMLPALAAPVACSSNAKNTEADAAEVPSATVAAVKRGSIVHTLNLAGQFQPYQVVDVHAKVSGNIRHIYVDIGNRVRQDQILAVLEVPELSAQLKGTVAEAASRKDEITRAENEVTRAQSDHRSLHADGRFPDGLAPFRHAGAGGAFTQLITDFGRTSNLVASSKLQEKARNANALAATVDIVIAADQAFYNALEAQALLRVAQQNVDTRQATQTQVNQMTKNNLNSTLDLSFADVILSQAKLLQLDAQNNADSTMATLDAVLGLDRQVTYELADSSEPAQPPPPDADQLIQLALQQRPDLQALNYDQQAAVKFSRAQRDQKLPSIGAAGPIGSVPIRPDQYYTSNWWGGIGVNMNVPIFNGFLYSAQAKEAAIRAQAASEQSRGLRDQIVRDVRTSWLAANTAFQRLSVTAELLQQANQALTLAGTRYQLGLSSIVELSQAQFQQTDAAIGNTNAQYQYRLTLATLNYQIGATP